MSKFVKHRPITLVFATEFSQQSVRKALDNKKTALFYNNCIYGDEALIIELLRNSLIIKKRYNEDNNKIFYDIHNISSAPVILYRAENTPDGVVPNKLTIMAKSNIHFYVSTKDLNKNNINFKVGNYFTSPGEELDFKLDL